MADRSEQDPLGELSEMQLTDQIMANERELTKLYARRAWSGNSLDAPIAELQQRQGLYITALSARVAASQATISKVDERIEAQEETGEISNQAEQLPLRDKITSLGEDNTGRLLGFEIDQHQIWLPRRTGLILEALADQTEPITITQLVDVLGGPGKYSRSTAEYQLHNLRHALVMRGYPGVTYTKLPTRGKSKFISLDLNRAPKVLIDQAPTETPPEAPAPKQRQEQVMRRVVPRFKPDELTNGYQRHHTLRILNIAELNRATQQLADQFNREPNQLEFSVNGSPFLNGEPWGVGPFMTDALGTLLRSYMQPPFSLSEASKRYGYNLLASSYPQIALNKFHDLLLVLQRNGIVGYTDPDNRAGIFLKPVLITDRRVAR